MARDLTRVRLEEIPEAGLDIAVDRRDARFAEVLDELGGSDGARDGEATVRLEIWPHRVDATGTLTVTLPQLCVRCLEPFEVKLHHEFAQYLMRSGADDPTEAPDEEIELSLQDLDRSELVGDVVDVTALLREELLLSMPTKPVCREDCKGICAGCGAELNSEPCTCEPTVDPRWDALKDLTFD
jgi:uncharacterized protein